MARVEPNNSSHLVSWRQLLLFLCIATAIGSAGAFFSYNGPLTSDAWHKWIAVNCQSAPNARDGAIFGPIKDIIRIALALVLVIAGFAALRIIPKKTSPSTRVLNWRPFSKPATAFEKRLAYEKAVIIAAIVLACLAIAIFRPLDFWGQSGVPKPTNFGYLEQIRQLYTTVFQQITRPYLFPYSLYILALWCALALPLLLVFFRSVLYDPIEYRQLLSGLAVESGEAPAPNVIATYERKAQNCFAFVDSTARNYVLFLIGVLVIAYVQQDVLGCSVLTGAADAGKLALLLFSASSFVAVVFWYLRYYGQIRATALVGIGNISDALEIDKTRDKELHDANVLAESVRQRDGLKVMTTFFTGGGVVALVFTFVWKVILGQNLCGAANGIFPTWIVNWVAKLFQTHCT